MIEYSALLHDFTDILKKNKLKFTKQRELILKTLYDNDGHFSPENILIMIKNQNPNINIGIATIYRTLSLLEDSGLASSISFGKNGKIYELGLKKHHDHLICQACGVIIEFVDMTIEKKQEEIARKHNFKMTDHTMKIVGLCQACQKNNK